MARTERKVSGKRSHPVGAPACWLWELRRVAAYNPHTASLGDGVAPALSDVVAPHAGEQAPLTCTAPACRWPKWAACTGARVLRGAGTARGELAAVSAPSCCDQLPCRRASNEQDAAASDPQAGACAGAARNAPPPRRRYRPGTRALKEIRKFQKCAPYPAPPPATTDPHPPPLSSHRRPNRSRAPPLVLGRWDKHRRHTQHIGC